MLEHELFNLTCPHLQEFPTCREGSGWTSRYRVVRDLSTLATRQSSLVTDDSKVRLWSLCSLDGNPWWTNKDSYKALAAVWLRVGMAWAKRVKWSVITRMCSLWSLQWQKIHTYQFHRKWRLNCHKTSRLWFTDFSAHTFRKLSNLLLYNSINGRSIKLGFQRNTVQSRPWCPASSCSPVNTTSLNTSGNTNWATDWPHTQPPW